MTIDHADVRCRGCPCERRACVTRAAPSRIAVVVDHPTEAEAMRDRWLVGKAGGGGALLRATLEAHADIDDLYICSALNCRPQTDKQSIRKNAMLACRSRLLEELREANVEKVLCVGAIGYSALMSSKRLDAITKIRGRWVQAYGLDIIATLPPGFVVNEPDYARDFFADIDKFFNTEGRDVWPEVEVWRPDTLAEMDEAFRFIEHAPFVSLDLETYGLSPIDNDVLAAGYGVLHDNEYDATIVVLDEAILGKKKAWRRIMQQLRSNQPTVFHNAQFDLQFLKEQAQQRDLPYRPRAIDDTMLLNYTLDERPKGRFQAHGLETLARVRYDAPDYGIHMGKFLDRWNEADEYDRRALRDEMHVYLGLDAYYTARLFIDLIPAVEAERTRWLYDTLLIPGAMALAEIEHHGILLDREMYEATRTNLEKQAEKIRKRIARKVGDKDFNPGSPKQVQAFIYDDLGLPFGLKADKDGTIYHTTRRGGLREGPTAAPVLKSLGQKFPKHAKVIDDICEYRNLTKNIGTYVNGLLNRLDDDGRLRTSFNLHGTGTGRLSSSSPNLQNIPDASHTGVEIRGGFVPSPGNVFVEADFKQLEVRIAAWLSGDAKMREVFESGRDPHQEIAFSIYRKPKEEITHYMRWLAKNILFGLLYGRGYESVATGPEQEDIAARGGKRWGIEEVKSFYENLLDEWEDYARWQEDQRATGYREGEVVMKTGRRKRFPFISKHDGGYVGRASFNNPIQGTASDFCLYALIVLHETLPEGAHLVLTVHDSLMVECREDQADEVAELMRSTMETNTLFPIDVPLLVDIDIESRWGGDEFARAEMLLHGPKAQGRPNRDAARKESDDKPGAGKRRMTTTERAQRARKRKRAAA